MKFIISACLYLILFYSIFTVYYTSPLVRDVPLIPLNVTPLATHLIFIVTDGMRADKLFGNSMQNAPFLRTLLLNRAIWGISHTRVPTESRPGHVAMLGGFYEDVSSITKGWQANPVEFDSILNRSLRAWAWGTHEVVRPFESVDPDHVSVKTTPHHLADMARPNLNDADRWVVDQFLDLLSDSSAGFFASYPQSKTDSEALRTGHVAFLHLDAADLTGHAHKPSSPIYIEMIKHLDAVIAEVVHAVERSTSDLPVKVAFILTSDHGMTDWGSHGSGSLHETVTPLMAWGSGLIGPQEIPNAANNAAEFDQYGLPTHNYGRLRHEIKQADLCPLMASLLGIPIPRNSVGRVPLKLLDTDEATKVNLIRANCLQLIVQVQAKLDEQRASHMHLFFREFPDLKTSDISARLQKAEELTATKRYTEAISVYEQLADLSIEALNYYHKYDRGFLGFCIGVTFTLWSLLIISNFWGSSENHRKNSKFPLFAQSLRMTVLLLLFFTLFNVRSWPLSHVIYQTVPLLLALYLLSSQSGLRFLYACFQFTGAVWDCYANRKAVPRGNSAGLLVASIILIELMIWGFHYRPLLSVACLVLAGWPFMDMSFGRGHKRLRLYWSICCSVLACFPLLPVIGSAFYPLLGCIGGLLLVPLCFFCVKQLGSTFSKPAPMSTPNSLMSGHHFGLLLCCLLAASSCCVAIVHTVPGSFVWIRSTIHIFAWLLLPGLPLVVVCWSPSFLGYRLFGWTLVFLIPFVLLSIGYEVFFFAVFCTVGVMWIQLEAPSGKWSELWSMKTVSGIPPPNHRITPSKVTFKDFRQALFFIFLLTISFFGTGNIASVNSFDPRSTYCFVTSLKPMVMGFFLLMKILCPMLCLGIIYAAVQAVGCCDGRILDSLPDVTHVLPVQLGLVSVMSNFIAMHFFLWLRDEGSWLDIGNSISHYVIAMGIGFAAFLFARLGRVMLSFHHPLSIPKLFTKYV